MSMWGALKATARMMGLRKSYPSVDPQFTKPQGMYDEDDIDLRKLRKLIKRGKLAPCYPGREFPNDESVSDFDFSRVEFEEKGKRNGKMVNGKGKGKVDMEVSDKSLGKTSSKPIICDECPICFLSFPCLNKSRCCQSAICTECYLRVRSPSNAPEEYDRYGRRVITPTKCPFCKVYPYQVVFVGAKTDEQRTAEAEEKAELAKALEAAKAAELMEQNERRKRREAAVAEAASRRVASTAEGTDGTDDTRRDENALASSSSTRDDDAGTLEGERDSPPDSPSDVPIGWEAEYAAMAPVPRDPNIDTSMSNNGPRWTQTQVPAPYVGSAERPTPAERQTRRDLEEQARRRALRRRDRNTILGVDTPQINSRRAERRRAFLPQGPAFLPGRSNPELFTRDLFGDHGRDSRGVGFGQRGGPTSGAALARGRAEMHAVTSRASDGRDRDERHILRELACRAESRRLRRQQAAAAAAEGDEESAAAATAAANAEEAFLQRVRDFIPARLLEESFSDVGDGLDGSTSRVLDIDDVMMMEAVYLSLREQEGASGTGAGEQRAASEEEARDDAEAAEAAEVAEAIALVAAAEAAEAAERAGREEIPEFVETVTDASVERVEMAVEREEAPVEHERAGDDASDPTPAPEAPEARTDGSTTEAEAELERESDQHEVGGFEIVDESLAALEADAQAITAHRLLSFTSGGETETETENEDVWEAAGATQHTDATETQAETIADAPEVSEGVDATEVTSTSTVIETPFESPYEQRDREAGGVSEIDTSEKNHASPQNPEDELAAATTPVPVLGAGAGAGAGAGSEMIVKGINEPHDWSVEWEKDMKGLEFPDVPEEVANEVAGFEKSENDQSDASAKRVPA